jgi:hypothetical protein
MRPEVSITTTSVPFNFARESESGTFKKRGQIERKKRIIKMPTLLDGLECDVGGVHFANLPIASLEELHA